MMKILMLCGVILSSLLISCNTTPVVKIEYIPVYKKAVNTCIKPSVDKVCKIDNNVDIYKKFELLQLCLLDKYEVRQELNNYIKCLESYFEVSNG